MELIVEVLDRNGRLREWVRVPTGTISIGRSYANDVVVQDEYVCPRHLQLRYDPLQMAWLVTDLASRNGSFVVGQGPLRRPHSLAPGDVIEIGLTRLRFANANQPPVKARRLPGTRVVVDYFSLPVIAVSLLFVTLAVFALDQFLGQGGATEWQTLLLQGILVLAVPFLWACIWSLIGRLLVHDARFAFHLSLGCLLMLSSYVVATIVSYVDFSFNASELASSLQWLLQALLFMVLLAAGLAAATRLRQQTRWVAVAVVTGSISSVLLLIGLVSPGESTLDQQVLVLKPPHAQLSSSVSLSEFMVNVDDTLAAVEAETATDVITH